VDKRLARFQDEHTPRLNMDLAKGLAVKQVAQAIQYLDSVFRAAEKSFPPGLEYRGCVRVSPTEEYHRQTTRGGKNNRRMYDVAESDLYMVKFLLRYEGVDLEPRYMTLPHLRPGGYFMQRGSQFVVSPVLNDIVFSVTGDTVFVRLLRDRINFERSRHTYVVNGERTDMAYVIHAVIHKKKDGKPSVTAKHSLMHYLLAKYGFDEAWQRFAGFVPVVGEGEINWENYPPDKWVICSSTNIRPMRGRMKTRGTSQLRMAIPIEQYNNNLVRSMVGGFFYVLDYFPDRVKADKDWLNSTRLWRTLLGLLIYNEADGEGSIHEAMTEHIKSLNDYMDQFVLKQLHDMGYNISDFYELLVLIMTNFNEWSRSSGERVKSMYGKELNVNYFLFMEVSKRIFYSVYGLTQRLATRKVITAKDVVEIFDKNLKLSVGYQYINQNCVSTMAIPNDNMALKLTTLLVPQTTSDAAKSGLALDDPAIRFHVSIAEVGGYTYLPKRAPDGRRRLNHCVMTDSEYRIIRNPRFIPLLDQVREMTSTDQDQ